MMDLDKLKEPFSADDIEWRVQRSGTNSKGPWAMVLAYVTARAIQDRLDDVCGPENWYNAFMPGPSGGVLCGISIKCETGWITKWDGAENTQIESVKGGLSDSTKRAAVQWGIGRYLYSLKAGWANFHKDGDHSDKIDGTYYSWFPPELPDSALPREQNQSGDGKPTAPPQKEYDPTRNKQGHKIPPGDQVRNDAQRPTQKQLDTIHGVGKDIGWDDNYIKQYALDEFGLAYDQDPEKNQIGKGQASQLIKTLYAERDRQKRERVEEPPPPGDDEIPY